jgi:hypothetical protein
MTFTARQKEVARWAFQNGQSEASFARDNAMPIGTVKWLFEIVSADLRAEERDLNMRVRLEMAGALKKLQLDSEHVGMLRYESCRMHCAGYPRRPDTV